MAAPTTAVHVTAGHNALRGSGPGQFHAFDHALARVGCPDRRIDRLALRAVCPPNRSHHARCPTRSLSCRECDRFLVALSPRHHRPGHASDLVGECDVSDLGRSPRQQSREPWPMPRPVELRIADYGESRTVGADLGSVKCPRHHSHPTEPSAPGGRCGLTMRRRAQLRFALCRVRVRRLPEHQRPDRCPKYRNPENPAEGRCGREPHRLGRPRSSAVSGDAARRWRRGFAEIFHPSGHASSGSGRGALALGSDADTVVSTKAQDGV